MIEYVMWTVYAITNGQEKVYVGMTSNLPRRIRQHNRGASIWTKDKGPWKLVYKKDFINSKIARSHEKYLKGGAGRKMIKKDIARVAELADAYA